MNSEMSIPNAGQCGGCFKGNRGVFQREQTALLAVTYPFEEKSKRTGVGAKTAASALMHALQIWRIFYIYQGDNS